MSDKRNRNQRRADARAARRNNSLTPPTAEQKLGQVYAQATGLLGAIRQAQQLVGFEEGEEALELASVTARAIASAAALSLIGQSIPQLIELAEDAGLDLPEMDEQDDFAEPLDSTGVTAAEVSPAQEALKPAEVTADA